MNAACMFWDNNGNKTLSYNPESRNWKAISTEEEFARARVFTSIYNDDKVLITFNYKEGTETVAFGEAVKAEKSSDMSARDAPTKER